MGRLLVTEMLKVKKRQSFEADNEWLFFYMLKLE